MDFVKREDQNAIDDENYKAYFESLQKSHQMDTEYLHTPISMEQLHQAMQSSINSSFNLQLPLSPRQMSTLMLKTNHLSRNLNFSEIPANLTRNDIDLVQNLTHELPQSISRAEDLVLTQNLSRNLDLTLARTLSNELELQNSLTQTLAQNLNEHELTRNLNNDLSHNLIRNEAAPQIRTDMSNNLTHELDLSHHINRQIEQEILNQNEPRRMVVLQENQLIDASLAQRLEQRLVNANLLHEQRIVHNEHLLPMPFHIKSEQEDDSYFYDNINQLNVNGINGHIPVHADHTQPTTLHQDQMYVYNNPNVIPALNPIDLYSRPQNYVQNYANNRENPQNLVVHRQFENSSSYEAQFKKLKQDGDENDAKKEEPKENLKPTDQNKIFYSEFSQSQNLYTDKNDNDSQDSKLTISEDLSMIKGEYACYKCNEIFPSKRGLKQHAKSCTENGENGGDGEKLGKFTCTQCAYRCQSPAILKIHERTHTGEKPFSCTFCDYKSGQKNNVAKHILVHMKEKPFSCQYCEYRCAQKNNLVVHERTHTGFKPFACPYCDYRTVQKPNLVKHMYLHTDQKPFSCDMCSYRCVQKTNLTKHKQRHLNEKDGDRIEVKNQIKPYRPRQKSVKCPHCSYRCVQKSSLEKHLQFKHCQTEFVEEHFDQNAATNDESVCETIQNLSVKKDEIFECQDKIAPLQIQS